LDGTPVSGRLASTDSELREASYSGASQSSHYLYSKMEVNIDFDKPINSINYIPVLV
jgi:hypothetical protein